MDEDIPSPIIRGYKNTSVTMLALVSFWTSLSEQQPGIVIEQLNDDENEWKGRFEFSACRHSQASQV